MNECVEDMIGAPSIIAIEGTQIEVCIVYDYFNVWVLKNLLNRFQIQI